MSSEEKMEMYKEIAALQNEQKSFKHRVSIIANLFLPGLGFYLYGGSLIKAIITFTLYISYLFIFFSYISPNTVVGWFYFIPAIIILSISTFFVAGEN